MQMSNLMALNINDTEHKFFWVFAERSPLLALKSNSFSLRQQLSEGADLWDVHGCRWCTSLHNHS